MKRIVTARLAGLLVLAGWALGAGAENVPAPTPAPPPPTLLKIGYVFDGKPVVLPVPMQIGAKEAPRPGQLADRWRVTPGLVLKADRQPADRTVELYQGKGVQRALVMLLNVRYFRNRDGHWQPHFQPNELPLVAPDGKGGWRPIEQAQGRAGLLVLHGVSLPNAEGYYPTLDFGLTIGRASIDSWVVN
jgi:hypothetical protein